MRLSAGFKSNRRSSSRALSGPVFARSLSSECWAPAGLLVPPVPKKSLAFVVMPSAEASSERRKVAGGFRSSNSACLGAFLSGAVRNGLGPPFSRYATMPLNCWSSAGSRPRNSLVSIRPEPSPVFRNLCSKRAPKSRRNSCIFFPAKLSMNERNES